MIRDNEDTFVTEQTYSGRSDDSPFLRALWLGGLGFVALAALIAAIYYAKDLGWPAYLMIIGLGALALIGFFHTVNTKRSDMDIGDTSRKGLMSREAFEAIQTPAIIIKDGKVRRANRAYLEFVNTLGLTSLTDTPPTVDRVFNNSDTASASAIFRLHHLRPDASYTEEVIETLTPQQGLRRYRVGVDPLKDGQLWQIIDITDSSGAQFDTLVGAPIGLFAITEKGKVLSMNAVLERWLGTENKERPGHISEFIENPDSLLDAPKSPGRTVRTETRLITQKGAVTPTILVATWQELSSGDIYASAALHGYSSLPAPDRMADTSVDAAQPLGRGVLTSTASPEAIAYNDSQPAGEAPPKSYSAAPFGILNLDRLDLANAKIKGFNAAMGAICGGKIAVGDNFASLFDGGETPGFLRPGVQLDSKPKDALLTCGEPRPVNIYIVQDGQAGCLIYVVDVSQRRELEQQLVQSQKMQAIGQLAGGVAHDFNNLLTAIRLNSDELLGRHPVGDPSYPELQKINATVNRAAGLVKKLLAFSRKQTLRTETLDVSETLSDVSVMLQDLLNDKINLQVVHGRGLPPIRADKNQFDNALMNLCVNARDAMMEGGGGTVTLRSSAATAAELMSDGVDSPTGENFVRIDVSDTGTGMDEATRSKIFEPFFTTKPQGKGTGLGLATVYGIMQQSGGYLTLDSELGVGSTFKLYWPVADAAQQASATVVPLKTEPRRPADLSGNGRILFVEDEDAVRTIAAKTLRKRGYDVTEACDGEEAYEILQETDEPFDLMISDVVMPGMDGPTLLKTARSLIGDARIVFISGYAEEEFSELLSEEPDVTFLPKPFTLTQLAEKVKAEIGVVS